MFFFLFYQDSAHVCSFQDSKFVGQGFLWSTNFSPFPGCIMKCPLANWCIFRSFQANTLLKSPLINFPYNTGLSQYHPNYCSMLIAPSWRNYKIFEHLKWEIFFKICCPYLNLGKLWCTNIIGSFDLTQMYYYRWSHFQLVSVSSLSRK